MPIPYERATSDMMARQEIKKILTRFGCQSIGFMDNMQEHEVLLAFTRPRPASSKADVGQRLGGQVGYRKIPTTRFVGV